MILVNDNIKDIIIGIELPAPGPTGETEEAGYSAPDLACPRLLKRGLPRFLKWKAGSQE